MIFRIFGVTKAIIQFLRNLLVLVGTCSFNFLTAQPVTARIDFPTPESSLRGVINEIRGEITTFDTFGTASLELIRGGVSILELKSFDSPPTSAVLSQFFNTQQFEDGEYVLRLSVKDKNGNGTSAETHFQIDNTAPSLKKPLHLNHLFYGDYALPRSVSCGIYGEVTEPLIVTDAGWTNEKGKIIGLIPANSITFENLEFSSFVTIPNRDSSAVRFWLRGEDRAGNTSGTFISNLVTLIDQVPTPIVSPSEDAFIFLDNDNQFQIKGLIWDSLGVFDRLEWRPIIGTETWTPVNEFSPVWQGHLWSFNWQPDDVLEPELEFMAWDKYGNAFKTTGAKVRIADQQKQGTQPPAVELTAPFGMIYQNPSTIAIKGTALSRSQQPDFDWSLDLFFANSDTWISVVSNESTQINNSLLTLLNVPQKEGIYRLRLTAHNSHGESVTTRSFLVISKGGPDSDADGWSDIREIELFGNLTESLETDFDGDGFSNGAETITGFDPRDKESKLDVITMDQDDNLILKWVNEAVLGYDLYQREQLNTGAWIKTSEVGSNDESVLSFSVFLSDNSPSMFYRIVEKGLLEIFGSVDLGSDVFLEFVKIPKGSFTMGSPSNELNRVSNEGPLTKVNISKDFLLSKYEVTIEQFRRFLLAEGDSSGVYFDHPDCPIIKDAQFSLSGSVCGKQDKQPMVFISWDASLAFCEWLTNQERRNGRLPTGYSFTLPTEAQWEYACRAGTTTRLYYGDDLNHDQLGTLAWYRDNSNNQTHPVGQKTPNSWGLYDMYGNAWEWCLDWWLPAYSGGVVRDPTGPEFGGDQNVLRGCSFTTAPGHFGSAIRQFRFHGNRSSDTGFRVALSQKESNIVW